MMRLLSNNSRSSSLVNSFLSVILASKFLLDLSTGPTRRGEGQRRMVSFSDAVMLVLERVLLVGMTLDTAGPSTLAVHSLADIAVVQGTTIAMV